MAGVVRADDILRNILSRLPAKPMGRCRCVSKHWNRLISDPDFMLSRSSRIFLASYCYKIGHICILDGNRESVTDVDFSMFKLPDIGFEDRFVTIVGSLSGIIVLVATDKKDWFPKYMDKHMVLYNPFTGAYEVITDPYSPFYIGFHAYGFGYGATLDELKIVRFRTHRSEIEWYICDVYNLKTRSWSQLPRLITRDFKFGETKGTFVKGYMYWMSSSKMVALNVDKMLISYIHLPDSAINKRNFLGMCNGCLWMVTNNIVETLEFDIWVMNEQAVDNSWSKACSLAIDLELFDYSRIIEITDDGRIIISVHIDRELHIIIYDTSKHSYKLLKNLSKDYEYFNMGIKYKESLTSPMDIHISRV